MQYVEYEDIFRESMKRIKEGAFLVAQSGGRVNVMAIGWAMFGFLWRRPVATVAVRESRFTFGLMEEADSFTISVPTGDMAKEIHFCGTKSGRDFDKFRECNLGKKKSMKVSSPIIDIPGYHYECKVVYKNAEDSQFLAREIEGQIYPTKNYHTLYFGEILTCYLIESS